MPASDKDKRIKELEAKLAATEAKLTGRDKTIEGFREYIRDMLREAKK